jgi:peptide chain release factor subunit 3
MSGGDQKQGLNLKAKPFVPKAKSTPAVPQPGPQYPIAPGMAPYGQMPPPQMMPPNYPMYMPPVAGDPQFGQMPPYDAGANLEPEETENKKLSKSQMKKLAKENPELYKELKEKERKEKEEKKKAQEQEAQKAQEKVAPPKVEEKKKGTSPVKTDKKEDKTEDKNASKTEIKAENKTENKKEDKKNLEEDKVPAEVKKSGEESEEPDLPANFAEVDEKRLPISIVFIGHVDVGKSTICGRIMVLTEKVDARTIKKYEAEAKEKKRETWWLAYVMDINDDERQRGKTVEVGRATFVTETKRYTIYDAPGHSSYVPNMIMGAAMADIGGLVISAKKGEFESGFDRGGQTIEHLLLAKSLGIQKLIVIINKMDEQSVHWSKERYEFIKQQLCPALTRFGFNLEKQVVFVPLSGLTGGNIGSHIEPKQCSWYQGPTLMELLEKIELPPRDIEGPIRIPVLDKMKDRGTDIFGKVHCGKIQVGTPLIIMPYKYSAEITSIQNTDDQLVKYAKAGENIKFRIKGLPNEDFIHKGCILCNPGDLCAAFQSFMAEVRVVNLLKHKPIISAGYQCVLHLHTLAEECTIDKLLGVKGPKDTDFKEAKFGKEEDVMRCLIKTKVIIAAEKFSVRKMLGRFTLRDEGKTIAIGTIQKYQPIKEIGGQ